MKKSLLFFCFVFFSCVFADAQSLKKLYRGADYKQVFFGKNYTLDGGYYSKTMKVRGVDSEVVVKHKLEGRASNIVEMNNKWYLLKGLKGTTAAKANYNLVELDSAGNQNYEVKAISSEEKIGGLKMYGPALVNTGIPFGTKLFKSKNNKFLLAIASKLFGSGVQYLGHELTHFCLFDDKMNIVFEGKYLFDVGENSVKELEAWVGNSGEVYLTINAFRDIVGAPNKIVVVKILQGNSVEEKMEVDLGNFNSMFTKTYHRDNKLVFAGFAEDASAKTVAIKGVYVASVDLANMKVIEKNICLFDSKHLISINALPWQVVPKAYWEKDKDKDNDSYLRHSFSHSMELSSDDELFVSFQSEFWNQHQEKKTSSLLVLKITDTGKKVSNLWEFGRVLNKVYTNCSGLVNVGGKVILLYADYVDDEAHLELLDAFALNFLGRQILTMYALLSDSPTITPVGKEMKGLTIDQKRYVFTNLYFKEATTPNEYISTFLTEQNAHANDAIRHFTYCKFNTKIFEE